MAVKVGAVVAEALARSTAASHFLAYSCLSRRASLSGNAGSITHTFSGPTRHHRESGKTDSVFPQSEPLRAFPS